MNGNIIQTLTNSKSVLIVLSKNAKLDGLAAALSLYLAFISQGKSARICSEANISESEKLISADKVSKTLETGGNVLKISFPYTDGNVDKVTYNITEDRFNLLIEPRTGAKPLESSNIEFGYTGGQLDLLVTIDAPNLEALGNIYLDNPDIFVREKIVNIDRRFDNQQFGAENLVEKQFSSTSEIVVKLMEALRWDLNPDMATNLYTGLVSATNNFTSFSTNAQSFEVAGLLLKNGARKIPLAGGRPAMPPSSPSPFRQPFAQQAPYPQEAAMPKMEPQIQSNNADQAVFSQSTKPVESQPPQVSQQRHSTDSKKPNKQPPQDWLKPKIFKSTDLI